MTRIVLILTRAAGLLTAAALSLWVGFAQAHDGLPGPRGLPTVGGIALTGLPTEAGEYMDASALEPVVFVSDALIGSRTRRTTLVPWDFAQSSAFGAAGHVDGHPEYARPSRTNPHGGKLTCL